jgi:NAD-dependent dihydropyrimidine dehydrogenase PreA subunit
MKRKIIIIDEDLCNGCGNCVSACSEGALQIIDGKARLVREDFCDGFGDCMGECPTGALIIEEREARPFDPEETRKYLLKTKGEKAVRRMDEAQKKHELKESEPLPCGCPGSISRAIEISQSISTSCAEPLMAQLRNWPVQISLLPHRAPYYDGARLLVAADCCAYAHAGFHNDFIRGHILAVGCPKLDNANTHREKLASILTENNIKSVEVAYMEVPCCTGLVRLVEEAVKDSGRNIPVRKTKIGIKGEVIGATGR